MKSQPVNAIVLLNVCQHIFDTMKLKVLFLLNCESPKYIAKFFPQYIYLNSSTYNIIQLSIIHTLGLERKQLSSSCFSSCFTLLYIVVVDIKLTCRGTDVPDQQDEPIAHLGLDLV